MQPLISAHRGGARDVHEQNRRATFERAASVSGIDAIEFDVHATRDGVFVLCHDAGIAGPDGMMCSFTDLTFDEAKQLDPHLMTMRDVLGIIKKNGKFAHVDLKFTGYEYEAMKEITAVLDIDQFIITTLEASSLRDIRGMARFRDASLGLSMPAYPKAAMMHPAPILGVARAKIAYSRADTIVANQQAARFILADLAASTNRKLLIWTPDEDADLREWLDDDRVWMVTTNRPMRAVELRSELALRQHGVHDRLG